MVARRSFIAGSLALLSQPSWAQERKGERILRVGVLDPLPSAINAGNIEQLRRGLRGAGYSEGKNLAEGVPDESDVEIDFDWSTWRRRERHDGSRGD